jgi:hypothetical protein
MASAAARDPPGILPPPLAFLSLLLFKLELLHSPLQPQHTNTRTRAPIPLAPPPLHHLAAGRRRWSTPWPYPFLPRTRSYPSRDACCPGEAVTGIAQRLELGSPPAGAPPEPPPPSNSITAAFPSPMSSPDASSRGEQSSPRLFFTSLHALATPRARRRGRPAPFRRRPPWMPTLSP